jgi:hypothetical protein
MQSDLSNTASAARWGGLAYGTKKDSKARNAVRANRNFSEPKIHVPRKEAF